MTRKLGRSFRVTIDMKDGGLPIVVTMPFTIQFWINRVALSDLNTMSLDIYNLSPENRSRIYQDAWNWKLDPNVAVSGESVRTVTIELGYENLYQVFTGHITQASSARDGVDIVTRIEAQSGRYDIQASQTFKTLDSGQSIASILEYLAGQFTGLKLGAIGDFSGTMQRPVVLNGSTWELLKTYSENNVYIDNDKIYILKPNEVVGSQVYVIDDSTGLLETPRRTGGTLIVTTLLEAGVEMFSEVKLTSTINPLYNGQYQVIGVRHEGTISDAISGIATTILTLRRPDLFDNFQTVAPK